jgi:TolA-binding protein
MTQGHEHPIRETIQNDTSTLSANGAAPLSPPVHAHEPEAPREAPARSMKDHVLTAVLALAFGMIGSYAFLRFHGESSPPAATDRHDETPDKGPSTQDLSDQIARLTDRLDGVSKQLKAMPEPEPPSGLSDLQVRVAEVSKGTEEIPSLREEIKRLDGRIDNITGTIALIRHDLNAIPTRPGTVRTTSAAPDAPPRPETATRRPETRERQEAVRSVSDKLAPPEVFEQGIALFDQQKYKDASEIFSKLEQTNPDDARVWYYAALAHGFATDQWTADGAGRLVEKGIEREKAGTPPPPVIDDAFKNLTSATGKDWLASYRNRASQR